MEEHKNLGVNFDLKGNQSTPPTFDGQSENGENQPPTPPTFDGQDENGENQQADTSTIFGYVQSLFQNVRQRFFDNFFSGGFMQSIREHFMGMPQPHIGIGMNQPPMGMNQPPMQQNFGYGNANEYWGGNTNTNDYLFGNNDAPNTFTYGKGEGIDLVENTKTGDTINLYNVTLGDITNVEITNSSISLVVGEDQGIGVKTSDEISPNFKLADGETYNYNRTSGQWQKA